MELVSQFGYVILFGQIFPLGAFFSYFSNEIQIYTQVDNLKYMRRPKPEVAEDIGSWLPALEVLSNVNVVTNTMLLYYTHKSYRLILTEEYADGIDDRTEKSIDIQNPGLAMAEFLMALIIVEHLQIGIKALVNFLLGNTPEMVTHGLMERKMLLEKFQKTKSKSKNKKKRVGDKTAEPGTAISGVSRFN